MSVLKLTVIVKVSAATIIKDNMRKEVEASIETVIMHRLSEILGQVQKEIKLTKCDRCCTVHYIQNENLKDKSVG